MKDLKRRAHTLSRSTVQASPRTGRDAVIDAPNPRELLCCGVGENEEEGGREEDKAGWESRKTSMQKREAVMRVSCLNGCTRLEGGGRGRGSIISQADGGTRWERKL